MAYYLAAVIDDIQSLDLEQAKTVADLTTSDTRHGYSAPTPRAQNARGGAKPDPQAQNARATVYQNPAIKGRRVHSKAEILKSGLNVKLAKFTDAKRAVYNGLKGNVVTYNRGKQTYIVKLKESGQCINVARKNILAPIGWVKREQRPAPRAGKPQRQSQQPNRRRQNPPQKQLQAARQQNRQPVSNRQGRGAMKPSRNQQNRDQQRPSRRPNKPQMRDDMSLATDIDDMGSWTPGSAGFPEDWMCGCGELCRPSAKRCKKCKTRRQAGRF